MREIKFRAWDGKNMLLEFSGLANLKDGLCHLEIKSEEESEYPELLRRGLKKSDRIFMQFTGLHDKNGQMIWEGDIVGRVFESSKNVQFMNKVIFHNGQFGLEPTSHGPMLEKIENGLIFIQTHVVEVLGNICENQELQKNLDT